MKTSLASVVEKLQNDTKEFQQKKDEVELLKAQLREREDELQNLRTEVQQGSGKLRRSVPPVEAGKEEITQMQYSRKCLDFLKQLMPDQKQIEELRSYEYRMTRRPHTI